MEELQANGYHKKSIESTRKKMLLSKNKDRNYMEFVLEDRQVLGWWKPRIVIPYKHGDSDGESKWIWRILDPYNIKYFSSQKSPTKTAWDALKTPIPFQHQSGAIHSISCSDCGKQYIGETRRYIAERVPKHRMHTVTGNVSGSTHAEHACISDHVIDLDSCKIIDKEKHWKKSKHLESFYTCQRWLTIYKQGKITFANKYLTLFYSKTSKKHTRFLCWVMSACNLYIAMHFTLSFYWWSAQLSLKALDFLSPM